MPRLRTLFSAARPVVVDASGVTLPGSFDEPIDLVLNGHRAWSFNPAQDGVPRGSGTYVAWPAALRHRLRGVAAVSVVPHRDGALPLLQETVEFDDSREALELVDDLGHPLSVDKGGRLQRTFDRFVQEAREELVEATRKVLHDLNHRCDTTAYLAYGCLLGAIRDGHMIGHDSDSDVAFLSRHTHPFDIIRESRRIESRMRELGWRVVRLSAANFKVWVPLPGGKRAGVDVFGSFHVGDRFHLTGSLRGTLPLGAIVPLGEVVLEGVPLPAPADPEALLAFSYGPRWRTPDPSFRFLHPPENVAIMSAWLRTTRRRQHTWEHVYRSIERIPREESLFARWVHERLDPGSHVLELGAGTGRDTIYLTRQGHRVIGTDRASKALSYATRRARMEGLDIAFRSLNLESTHKLLLWGAQLANAESSYDVYARGVVDALHPDARPGLWRLCDMAGRRGGRTFLEFRTRASRNEPMHFGRHARTWARPQDLVAEIEGAGGTVTEQVVGRGLAPLGEEDPQICRLVVTWSSRRTTAAPGPTPTQRQPDGGL